MFLPEPAPQAILQDCVHHFCCKVPSLQNTHLGFSLTVFQSRQSLPCHLLCLFQSLVPDAIAQSLHLLRSSNPAIISDLLASCFIPSLAFVMTFAKPTHFHVCLTISLLHTPAQHSTYIPAVRVIGTERSVPLSFR